MANKNMDEKTLGRWTEEAKYTENSSFTSKEKHTIDKIIFRGIVSLNDLSLYIKAKRHDGKAHDSCIKGIIAKDKMSLWQECDYLSLGFISLSRK